MIAVIAGTGTLPLEACKNLKVAGKSFFVITLFPENNAVALQEQCNGHADIVTQPYFKPSQILQLLIDRSTTHVFFIGKVDKNNLLKHLKLDWLAVKMLGKLITKSDKDIMEALLNLLQSHNIQVLRQDEVLGGLLVKPGILTGTISPEVEKDIRLGLETAVAIAHANIGQTVIIKNGMVLAVEAIEGTDACIARGIQLGQDGVVICKAARSDQNKRYDLPTLGPSSLTGFKPGQVAAVAWQYSHTLIAQKEDFIAKAQELGIVLMSADHFK